MAGTPGKEHAYISGLEDQFCKDYSCCGLQLDDMHELIQHFEENHVVMDSDMDEGDDLQFQFENNNELDLMDIDDDKQAVAPSDIYQNDLQFGIPAFDTSVIRKRTLPANNNSWKTPKKKEDSPPQTFPLDMEGPTTIIQATQEMSMDEDLQKTPIPKKKDSSPATTNSGEKRVKKEKDDRPYKCKINGCAKAYKNPGGLKYHMHHGHCEDTGDPEMNNIIHKPYQCTVMECGKRYKNLNGLKVKVINCSIILNMHIVRCWDQQSEFLLDLNTIAINLLSLYLGRGWIEF